MISHSRKSDEKCYAKELTEIHCCDKEIVHSGTEYINLLLFNFPVYIYTRSYPVNVSLLSITALTSIDCHWLLSLAVRYNVTYSTSKSLRKIVEVMCCDK